MVILLGPLLAWSAEKLPDSSPPDKDTPETDAAPAGQPLKGEEMGAFYLQSPVELDTSDEKKGLNAVSSDNRYLDNDNQDQTLQRQAESLRPAPLPSQDEQPKAPPPTLMPIRGL